MFLIKNRFKSRLGPNLARLGSILAPFLAPFWHPKRSKNDVKKHQKKKRKKNEKVRKSAQHEPTCASKPDLAGERKASFEADGFMI